MKIKKLPNFDEILDLGYPDDRAKITDANRDQLLETEYKNFVEEFGKEDAFSLLNALRRHTSIRFDRDEINQEMDRRSKERWEKRGERR